MNIFKRLLRQRTPLLFSYIFMIASFLAASTSTAAVTFTTIVGTSLGSSLDAVQIGEVVTIDITLRSDGQTAFGAGGSVIGYDPGIFQLQSGDAVADVLAQVCIPGLGCFGGLDNGTIAAAGPFESFANPLGPEVQFLNAAASGGTSFSGVVDIGFDGISGSPQFTTSFLATAAGTTTFEIGADENYGDALILSGGAIGVTNSAFVTATVVSQVPIPAAAWLFGSALLGLGLVKRRQA